MKGIQGSREALAGLFLGFSPKSANLAANATARTEHELRGANAACRECAALIIIPAAAGSELDILTRIARPLEEPLAEELPQKECKAAKQHQQAMHP